MTDTFFLVLSWIRDIFFVNVQVVVVLFPLYWAVLAYKPPSESPFGPGGLKGRRLFAWCCLVFLLLSLLRVSQGLWSPLVFQAAYEWRSGVEKGVAAYEKGDWGGAAEVFRDALEQVPGATGVRVLLADCCARLNQKDEAIKHYMMVLKTDDTGPWAVQSRRALRDLQVDEPCVSNPIHTLVPRFIDVATARAKLTSGEKQIVHVLDTWNLIWLAWVMLAVLLWAWGDPRGPQINWMWMVDLVVFAAVSWPRSALFGVTIDDWYMVTNGWFGSALQLDVIVTVSFLLASAVAIRGMPEIAGAVLCIVVGVTLVVAACQMHECLASRAAVTVARGASVICVVIGTQSLRGLGDFRDMGVSGAILGGVCHMLLGFLWFVCAPCAIHGLVFLRVIPTLAANYDMTIPQYFWELPVVQAAAPFFGVNL